MNVDTMSPTGPDWLRNCRRVRLRTASWVFVVLVAAACTGASEQESSTREAAVREGGTLRVAFATFEFAGLTAGPGLDPQKDYWYDSFELFRCCLLRTLLSHSGRPTEEGGARLRPDLASELPEVSADGLVWTFRIKPGLHYAPPYEDVEIVAADFIRALEREADPKAAAGGYSFYYSVIAGFDEFATGRADSISGLEAPAPQTLVVRLTEPQGDLGNLFTLPATAPIPPDAAEGHDDGYGSFLVASGPYMIEGSEDLDFSVPPEDQEPVSGYVVGKSITLVRNPSWSRDSDDLRPAYVDRIEIKLSGTRARLARRVSEGKLDMQIYTGPPPQEPPEAVRAFESDPQREDQVFIESRDFLRYIPMNVALPPFDDIHVRKAMNFVIDKSALRDLRGGPITGAITGHLVLNSLENNLLVGYDPYATPQGRGSLKRAKAEMRRSRYDRDNDGVCDDVACRDVRALSFVDQFTVPFEAMAESVADDLARIGLELELEFMEPDALFTEMGDPANKVPIALGPSWGKDFLNASNFVIPLLSSEAIGMGGNQSLVGASPRQLRTWGYRVQTVPNIDNKIDQCRSTLGSAQFECWAEADQLLMEQVAPWVPVMEENHVQLVSDRVVSFSFDQFASLPALERIALRAGGD